MKTVLLLLLVSMNFAGQLPHLSAAEGNRSADDQVHAAKVQRAKAIDEETAAFSAAVDKVIKEATAAGSLGTVNELIAQRDAFQKSGISPSAASLKAAVEKYVAGRRNANTKLVEAYQHAIAEFSKSQEIAKLNATQLEMNSFMSREAAFLKSSESNKLGQVGGQNASSGKVGDQAKEQAWGQGFGIRSKEHRDAALQRYGGDKNTERAVNAALNWLARHQNPDGSWSIDKFDARCHGGKCDGLGSISSDAAATAFGILPFLGAGHSHITKGIYEPTVRRGLNWLIAHQNKTTGGLSAGPQRVMYAHGLATIALCEAYGLTKDAKVGFPAQAALKFIESAQNAETGGWRYNPGEAGDTSVLGWQLMGLKSGLMANLQVAPATLVGANKWLAAASGENQGGRFSYQVGGGKTVSMTAVGCLCRQYLGAKHDDPGLADGVKVLLDNAPENTTRNVYYWYYATQVMHNMLGEKWDSWNSKMRQSLVETQELKGCAAGSWSPERPKKDAWGSYGGRVMMTSLSCLILEVYYRYPPVYENAAQAANGQ